MSIKVIKQDDGAYFVSWSSVRQAENYRIQIARDSFFNDVIDEHVTVGVTQFVFGKLNNSRTHYVRVLACLSYGQKDKVIGEAIINAPETIQSRPLGVLLPDD